MNRNWSSVWSVHSTAVFERHSVVLKYYSIWIQQKNSLLLFWDLCFIGHNGRWRLGNNIYNILVSNIHPIMYSVKEEKYVWQMGLPRSVSNWRRSQISLLLSNLACLKRKAILPYCTTYKTSYWICIILLYMKITCMMYVKNLSKEI